MKKRSINVIIQLLLIENVDLTKVVLNFILELLACKSTPRKSKTKEIAAAECDNSRASKHFGYTFALHNLVDNGLIEALMLSLHTRNGKRVLKILEIAESYCTESNTDYNWENEI